MNVPQTNFNPPFRFRRASHVVFTSRDLVKSREFYTEVVGLLVSDEDRNTLYLRGLEERAHHSLVVKHSDEPSACHRVGMRVFEDEELDRAKHHFEKLGLPCQWVDVPFQGRTLQVAARYGRRGPPRSRRAAVRSLPDHCSRCRQGGGVLHFDRIPHCGLYCSRRARGRRLSPCEGHTL